MKILMTGMSARQREYCPTNYLFDMQKVFKDYTETLKHKVDWRSVTIGEDLSKYDFAIVTLGPVHGLSARTHALQALYVMSHLPTVVYFDDWQVHQAVFGLRQVQKKFAKLVTKEVNGKPFYKDGASLLKYETQVLDMVNNFLEGGHKKNNHHLCLPLFTWGDRKRVHRLLPHKSILDFREFDPSPEVIIQGYVKEKEINYEAKQKRWFLPTLLDHTKWLDKINPSWEVDWIGHKKKTGVRVDEREVFERAEKYWGYLSPVYNHDGSGWYRTRFMLSAFSGTVLLTGPLDAEVLGNVPMSVELISNIENGSYNLKELAQFQKSIILSHVKDKEFLREQVKRCLVF